MSDTIRVITYGDINVSATDNKDSSKIAAGRAPFLQFDEIENPSETPSESALRTGAKGIGEFEVKVDTLEAEMGHLYRCY